MARPKLAEVLGQNFRVSRILRHPPSHKSQLPLLSVAKVASAVPRHCSTICPANVEHEQRHGGGGVSGSKSCHLLKSSALQSFPLGFTRHTHGCHFGQ